MRFLLFPCAAIAGLLAACSQPAPRVPEEASATADSPAAAPPPTPAIAPPTAAAIPEQFRGVWDNAEGTCMASSDLRMEIGAVSIEFYESLGTVTGVTIESPDAIVVDLAMEGEGERWTVQNRLTLSANGQRLTPSDTQAGKGQPMPRKRCDAA